MFCVILFGFILPKAVILSKISDLEQWQAGTPTPIELADGVGLRSFSAQQRSDTGAGHFDKPQWTHKIRESVDFVGRAGYFEDERV